MQIRSLTGDLFVAEILFAAIRIVCSGIHVFAGHFVSHATVVRFPSLIGR